MACGVRINFINLYDRIINWHGFEGVGIRHRKLVWGAEINGKMTRVF